MMPMGMGQPGGSPDETEIKKKILGNLQDSMAQRRLVNIVVDLDNGTVQTDAPTDDEGADGQPEPDGDESASGMGGGDDMGEPQDVLGRLKKLTG